MLLTSKFCQICQENMTNCSLARQLTAPFIRVFFSLYMQFSPYQEFLCSRLYVCPGNIQWDRMLVLYCTAVMIVALLFCHLLGVDGDGHSSTANVYEVLSFVHK